ncbi:hypothetical protein GTQ34_07485 [Muricauda sp. JGD-17]|uniref:SRPBCC family protein n=1 Tax=Flagellimonas ochracea TaxID=2696472 RepID=A0A964TCI9_9FLAO|nr:SRPBCC family protein [Allomuricauda ochracea]NAY91754.1 hypothetical protein [Allomuricauda ochracea]
MRIEKSKRIDAPIQKAWSILGHDFANPHKWASPVNHSQPEGFEENQMRCNERSCTTEMGNIRERLIAYSDDDHSLKLEVTEGLPFFMKTITNRFNLIASSGEQTDVHIELEMIPKGLMGFLMVPLMKYKMSKMWDDILDDFAYYVEYDRPHPRKVQKMEKFLK